MGLNSLSKKQKQGYKMTATKNTVTIRVVVSEHAEDVMKRIMKKNSLANFSEVLEYLCGFHEGKDK